MSTTRARRAPLVHQESGYVSLHLCLDGEAAKLTGRVAGLSRSDEEELDRRLREELANSRMAAREIRINGRLIPATQGV